MHPFYVKDCALSVIATGESAASLADLREILERITPSSIYYHFWGDRLRPGFVQSEYLNDFASWAHFDLHDDILAERLAIIDPTAYSDMDSLRNAVLEVIERRVDESDLILLLKKEAKFYFLRSIITVFDTSLTANAPSDWKKIMPNLSLTSIFYHFIDARRRTPHMTDDLSSWFESVNHQEYSEIIQKIRHIDPYPSSLNEIKRKLCEVMDESFA